MSSPLPVASGTLATDATAAGASGGFHHCKTATEEKIIERLSGLCLGNRQLRAGVPVSGFVFYPRGSYTSVRAVLIDRESKGATEIAGSLIEKPG